MQSFVIAWCETWYMIDRMDSDQAARKNAQTHFGIVDPDYYEFEGNHE